MVFLGRIWGYRLETLNVAPSGLSHAFPMLTEAYIDALLVDEELADLLWEAWDRRDIDDSLAWVAWLFLIRRQIEVNL